MLYKPLLQNHKVLVSTNIPKPKICIHLPSGNFLNKPFQFSAQHLFHISFLHSESMILYHLIRMQHIRSNLSFNDFSFAHLTAPCIHILLRMILLLLLRFFLCFSQQQLRFHHLHRDLQVLMLIPLRLALQSISVFAPTSATIPEGRWVTRTALSVLFTCCPPGPEDRNRSICSSEGRIRREETASEMGERDTEANEVWRRWFLSKGEMRTKRCTPDSRERYDARSSPSSLRTPLWLFEPSSGFEMSLHFQFIFCAKDVYIARSIRVQSQASSPPAPT